MHSIHGLESRFFLALLLDWMRAILVLAKYHGHASLRLPVHARSICLLGKQLAPAIDHLVLGLGLGSVLDLAILEGLYGACSAAWALSRDLRLI